MRKKRRASKLSKTVILKTMQLKGNEKKKPTKLGKEDRFKKSKINLSICKKWHPFFWLCHASRLVSSFSLTLGPGIAFCVKLRFIRSFIFFSELIIHRCNPSFLYSFVSAHLKRENRTGGERRVYRWHFSSTIWSFYIIYIQKLEI